MTTKVISVYHQFQCLGEKCPDTCCRGWKIPVDQESMEQYQSLDGKIGQRLRKSVKGREMHYFKRQWGACPFYGKDGLCELQKDYTIDYMPFVCRGYPRKILKISHTTEITLELSCPQAARLFCRKYERLDFVDSTESKKPMWDMNNDDLEFLDFLQKSREDILCYLWDDSHTMEHAIDQIYEYVSNCHQHIVRNQLQEAKREVIGAVEGKSGNTGAVVFYPFSLIDKFIAYTIDSPRLKRANPQLKEMINAYYHYFNHLTSYEAGVFFQEKMDILLRERPEFAKRYRAYFSYYLQQCYLMAYEDYHILRIVMLGIAYLQLLMIFDLVNVLELGTSYDEMMAADRLAAMEKRVRHNEGIAEGMMNWIRKEFLLK